MRVVIEFPSTYAQRTATTELTAAELEAFTKVMDKLVACNDYYGSDEGIKLNGEGFVKYRAQVTSSRTTIVKYAKPEETPAAE